MLFLVCSLKGGVGGVLVKKPGVRRAFVGMGRFLGNYYPRMMSIRTALPSFFGNSIFWVMRWIKKSGFLAESVTKRAFNGAISAWP
jgi:hypothetical protein